MDSTNNSNGKNGGDPGETNQLIVAKDILPDIVNIIPISHWPIFPGMMIPIVLTGDFMIDTANKILESENKIDEANKLYQDIKKKYVNSSLVQSNDIDKYIERTTK